MAVLHQEICIFKFYEILNKTKVRFQFIDQDVVLEDWAEMIQLDDRGELKQVRFSPRLDFVPLIDKEKLELYYSARNICLIIIVTLFVWQL